MEMPPVGDADHYDGYNQGSQVAEPTFRRLRTDMSPETRQGVMQHHESLHNQQAREEARQAVAAAFGEGYEETEQAA